MNKIQGIHKEIGSCVDSHSQRVVGRIDRGSLNIAVLGECITTLRKLLIEMHLGRGVYTLTFKICLIICS